MCCDSAEVPLLEADVQRLAAGTGRPAEVFVEKSDGWLMLRGTGVPGPGCVFLGPVPHGGRGCTVHPHRPTACRTYPFLAPDPPGRLPVVDSFCPAADRFPRDPEAPDPTDLWQKLQEERRRRGGHEGTAADGA